MNNEQLQSTPEAAPKTGGDWMMDLADKLTSEETKTLNQELDKVDRKESNQAADMIRGVVSKYLVDPEAGLQGRVQGYEISKEIIDFIGYDFNSNHESVAPSAEAIQKMVDEAVAQKVAVYEERIQELEAQLAKKEVPVAKPVVPRPQATAPEIKPVVTPVEKPADPLADKFTSYRDSIRAAMAQAEAEKSRTSTLKVVPMELPVREKLTPEAAPVAEAVTEAETQPEADKEEGKVINSQEKMGRLVTALQAIQAARAKLSKEFFTAAWATQEKVNQVDAAMIAKWNWLKEKADKFKVKGETMQRVGAVAATGVLMALALYGLKGEWKEQPGMITPPAITREINPHKEFKQAQPTPHVEKKTPQAHPHKSAPKPATPRYHTYAPKVEQPPMVGRGAAEDTGVNGPEKAQAYNPRISQMGATPKQENLTPRRSAPKVEQAPMAGRGASGGDTVNGAERAETYNQRITGGIVIPQETPTPFVATHKRAPKGEWKPMGGRIVREWQGINGPEMAEGYHTMQLGAHPTIHERKHMRPQVAVPAPKAVISFTEFRKKFEPKVGEATTPQPEQPKQKYAEQKPMPLTPKQIHALEKGAQRNQEYIEHELPAAERAELNEIHRLKTEYLTYEFRLAKLGNTPADYAQGLKITEQQTKTIEKLRKRYEGLSLDTQILVFGQEGLNDDSISFMMSKAKARKYKAQIELGVYDGNK